MNVDDIQEGSTYKDNRPGTYCRVVRFIIDSPHRPGGKLVVWDTDGFSVRGRESKMHGKCGIKTFAAWAHTKID